MRQRTGLDVFFAPHGVAVVGATPNELKGGYSIIANMLESFAGPVYPVNPGRDEVLGVKCHRSVRELAGKVDLAIVFVPAASVPGVLEDCAAAGVKAAVLESGGFAEVGEEGRRIDAACREIAARTGLRLWGPNCTGLVNTDPFIFTPFMRVPDAHERLKPGTLGIIAQSGMLAAGFMLQYVISGYFTVSKACAIGNKIDVDEVEVLRYMSADPKTRAVVAYLESIVDGRAFLEVTREMAGRKPLVVLKGGRYEESARAALSHTASLAGSDEVVDGALRQAGVIRVDDFQELMNLVPYIKVGKKEKLALRLERVEDYDQLYTREEIDELLSQVVSYYIDPEKCQACMRCAKRCPVEVIVGAKNQVHVIDQEKCIKCGTCLEACPPRFSAVVKIIGAHPLYQLSGAAGKKPSE